MRKEWIVALKQTGTGVPSIKYEENGLGITPVLSRTTDGTFLISFNQSLEGKLLVFGSPVIEYETGIANPPIRKTTCSYVNDVDGEITIANRVYGEFTDDFDGLYLHVVILD